MHIPSACRKIYLAIAKSQNSGVSYGDKEKVRISSTVCLGTLVVLRVVSECLLFSSFLNFVNVKGRVYNMILFMDSCPL